MENNIDAAQLSKAHRRQVMPSCAQFLLEFIPAWPDAQITATEGEYVWRHNMPDALMICKRNGGNNESAK